MLCFPFSVLQPCMFRKSFKIEKKWLTGNCLQANIKESREINYIQIRLIIGMHSQIPHGLAHVYTLDHSFMAFSVSFPSLSTLIQTRVLSVCLLGHEGPRASCLDLFLIPWVLAATASLTPGFLGFCPYKLCGPWWQLRCAELWELPAVFQTHHFSNRFSFFPVGQPSTRITTQRFLIAHLGTHYQTDQFSSGNW